MTGPSDASSPFPRTPGERRVERLCGDARPAAPKAPKASAHEKQSAAREKRRQKELKTELETKLHTAAKTNNVCVSRTCLLLAPDGYFYQLALAKECLEGGADVNKREGGWTPLHFAASKNSPDVGRL
eukprot:763860-Hanusia_phi.AAC.4